MNCGVSTWDERYKEPKWEMMKIVFEADLHTPDYGVENSRYSVKDINKGAVAWLESEKWEKKPIRIFAGTTLDDFVAAMLFVLFQARVIERLPDIEPTVLPVDAVVTGKISGGDHGAGS